MFGFVWVVLYGLVLYDMGGTIVAYGIGHTCRQKSRVGRSHMTLYQMEGSRLNVSYSCIMLEAVILFLQLGI